MKTKLPSFQFYPGDWKKDPSLSVVSLSAKGLWIDMLCLMFESERRGYLQINGKPPSIEQLARMVRSDVESVRLSLEELENAAVFFRDKSHIIYSKRMVRDEIKRKKLKKNGEKGGNPAFKEGNTNPYYPNGYNGEDNQAHNQKDKQAVPSSTSTSSSNTIVELDKEQVYTLMRRFAVLKVSNRQIHDEVAKFVSKFDNTPIDNLAALIQGWLKNVRPKKQEVAL